MTFPSLMQLRTFHDFRDQYNVQIEYTLKIRKYPKIVLILNLYEMNRVLKSAVQFQIFLRITMLSHVSDI